MWCWCLLLLLILFISVQLGIKILPHTCISPPTIQLGTVSWLHVMQNFLLFPNNFHQGVHWFLLHFVSSNGDSHVMLVSTFVTDVTNLGTIAHLTTTTHIPFTTYYPPSDRQWVICQVEFLTVPNAFHQGVHRFLFRLVSSNGDSHVILVSTFATSITHLGTVGHAITTTHIPFTTYYPPSDRQWVICQVEFLTVPNAFHQRVHRFLCRFVSSNGDSHVMLVSTFATSITHLGTIGHPITTTHIHFTTYYPPSDRQWVICQVEFLTVPIAFHQRVQGFICHFTTAWLNFSLK